MRDNYITNDASLSDLIGMAEQLLPNHTWLLRGNPERIATSIVDGRFKHVEAGPFMANIINKGWGSEETFPAYADTPEQALIEAIKLACETLYPAEPLPPQTTIEE